MACSDEVLHTPAVLLIYRRNGCGTTDMIACLSPLLVMRNHSGWRLDDEIYFLPDLEASEFEVSDTEQPKIDLLLDPSSGRTSCGCF